MMPVAGEGGGEAEGISLIVLMDLDALEILGEMEREEGREAILLNELSREEMMGVLHPIPGVGRGARYKPLKLERES
jgi:hypothetical protein